jgi:hypothetical protein
MASGAKIVVRRVPEDDEVLEQLLTFRCADADAGPQVEVENWVRNDLSSWVFASGAAIDEPQLLATLDHQTGELIGVFVHEHAWLQRGGVRIAAEKITVAAVALDYQRKHDVEDRRYSDLVMSSGLQAIEARMPPQRQIFGLVHVENGDSFRLLQRHNMSRRISTGTAYDIVTH